MEPRRTKLENGDEPTAWFAALRRAMRTRNLALASKALRELTRRGVAVAFVGDEPTIIESEKGGRS